MEIINELDRIYSPIKEELQAVEKKLYDLVPDDLEPISTAEKYIFDNGGKRLRPALVLLSARAAHSTNISGVQSSSASSGLAARSTSLLPDRVITFAVAAELIHTATLIHDDLLDGSVLRRGHRTVNSRWGNATAMLLGDHLYLKATEILTSEDILNSHGSGYSKQVHRASNLMLQTAARIFKGEVLQYQKRGKLYTTEEDYYAIIESKSASFISSCCMIGVLLNGNDCPGADEQARAVAHYGLNLGIAFQIKDDILDLMGDEKRIGKAVGSDLKEGRLTLPVIHLMANAGDDDREYLERVLQQSVLKFSTKGGRLRRNGSDLLELRRIRNLLLNYGSIAYSMDVASNFAQKSKKDLTMFSDSSAKQSLISLADQVITRDY